MRLLFLALCALGLGNALAQTSPPPFKASPAMSMELRNAQWFDGSEFRRGSLYVEDGRFVAAKPKRVNRRMELKGQYLISPLGEAHNHNLQNEWGYGQFARSYLQDGVFYAAMLCGDPAGVAPVRKLAGGADAPDVAFVTACITSSDGHPLEMLLRPASEGQPAVTLADVADKAVLVMDSPAQVREKWPLVQARKSELIKLVLSYHEREDLRGRPELMGKLGLRAEVAAEIVRMAHASGQRVAAHVDSAADFEAAVRAGVDQIAHLPGYFPHHGDAPESYLLSPASIELAAQRKIAVITTTAATGLFKADADLQARIREVQKRNLQMLRDAGVPLLLGSDVFTGTALAEFRSLAALGVLSPAELLRIATQDTPRAIFPKRRLGCFEPGCDASFLVLAGHPLQDPAAVEQPLLRVKQGRILTLMDDVASTAGGTADTAASKKSPVKSGKKGKASGKPASKPTARPAVKAASARKR